MGGTYREIADDLRRSILSGEYRPGDTLPKARDLAAQYGVAYQTVRSAIAVLESEGLVEAIRRRGTVVRDRPARRLITRSRQVYRDELGYYFDPSAQQWRAMQPPTVGWGPAPPDVAPLLGIEVGTEVLIRDRIMGDPETGRTYQLATSYLPEHLARGTVLAERDTGPGGIYDRLEEMGHGPLRWTEAVSARMPTPEETKQLALPPGVPVLRIVRTAISPAGVVCEVNDTRMSAAEFEVGYTIRRSSSARWPRQESDANTPEDRGR